MARDLTAKLFSCSLCLNNDFVFDDKLYLQVQGTAMGHRYAPAYTNIYMSEWEREALAKCRLQPTFYLHFLDDIIGAWPHGQDTFQEFIDTLNHHPSIKVKYEISKTHQLFGHNSIFQTHRQYNQTTTHKSLFQTYGHTRTTT